MAEEAEGQPTAWALRSSWASTPCGRRHQVHHAPSMVDSAPARTRATDSSAASEAHRRRIAVKPLPAFSEPDPHLADPSWAQAEPSGSSEPIGRLGVASRNRTKRAETRRREARLPIPLNGSFFGVSAKRYEIVGKRQT